MWQSLLLLLYNMFYFTGQTTPGNPATANSPELKGPDVASIGLGIGIGAVVLVLLIVAALVLRKWRNSNSNVNREVEKSDFNPVYGTYEVHDDPVAEVGSS